MIEIFAKKASYDTISIHSFLDFMKFGELLDEKNPVIIKPNLMAFTHVDFYSYTNPILINAIHDYVKSVNKKIPVIIAESNNMFSMVFKNFTVENVIKKLKVKGEILNLSNQPKIRMKFGDKIMDMPEPLDRNSHEFILINLPKMKTHSNFGITCGLKNMYGCLPEINKFVVYHRNWNVSKAIASIHEFVKPDFTIIDAIHAQDDWSWVLAEKKSGYYVDLGYLFGCRNPLVLDCFIVKWLEMKYKIEYIEIIKKHQIYDDDDFIINAFDEYPDKCKFTSPTSLEKWFWKHIADKFPFTNDFMEREMKERMKGKLVDEFLYSELF